MAFEEETDMKHVFASEWNHITSFFGRLFAVLLIIQGPLPGLMMCFGSNGHIAIETSHSPFRHPTAQDQEPCLDVPLISVSSHNLPLMMAPSSMPQRFVPVPMLASTFRSLLASVLSDILLLSPHRAIPQIASAYTVILQI